MKFYFAGAIRGGREKLNTYIKINELLNNYGEVLDKHVADPNVNSLEKGLSLSDIYTRDIKWIKECDAVIAEVSTPSLGVGYEVCFAEQLGIPVIALCDISVKVSAMIAGNKYFDLILYDNDEELLEKLNNKLKSLNNTLIRK